VDRDHCSPSLLARTRRAQPNIVAAGGRKRILPAPLRVRRRPSWHVKRFLRAALEGCPQADDAVLCLSELASNSVLHSNSRKPGGTFTVRATSYEGDYVYIEVEDHGGPWQEPARRGGRPHGLRRLP
jgi:hypothetical protein